MHRLTHPIKHISTFTLVFAALMTNAAAANLGGFAGTVTRVSDGDTVVVVDDRGAIHRVRLAYIDAPEVRHPNEPEQPYSVVSQNFVSDAIQGAAVLVVLTGKDTKYQRDVGVVYRASDKYNVNLGLVTSGLAWAERTYKKGCWKLSAPAEYVKHESDTRARRKGLFKDEDALYPGVWRAQFKNNVANAATKAGAALCEAKH